MGTRVQIPAYTDTWMRGARYGEVVSSHRTRKGVWIAMVQMDHPQLKRPLRFLLDDCEELPSWAQAPRNEVGL